MPAVSGKVQADLYYNRANLLLRQGKKSPALSNLEYAAESDPQNAKVASLQGWIEFAVHLVEARPAPFKTALLAALKVRR